MIMDRFLDNGRSFLTATITIELDGITDNLMVCYN